MQGSQSKLHLHDSVTKKANSVLRSVLLCYCLPIRGPAPSRDAVDQATGHIRLDHTSLRGQAAGHPNAQSLCDSSPGDGERPPRRAGLGNHGLPPDVVDKLLVIYFTHVHVSATSGRSSSLGRISGPSFTSLTLRWRRPRRHC